jgi:hypothetical protein
MVHCKEHIYKCIVLVQLEEGGGREAVNNGAAYLGESLLLLDSKRCYSKDNPLHSIAMDLVLISFIVSFYLLSLILSHNTLSSLLLPL